MMLDVIRLSNVTDKDNFTDLRLLQEGVNVIGPINVLMTN